MNQLGPITADRALALIAAAGARASYRFFEFLTAQTTNEHTRRTYAHERKEARVPVPNIRRQRNAFNALRQGRAIDNALSR